MDALLSGYLETRVHFTCQSRHKVTRRLQRRLVLVCTQGLEKFNVTGGDGAEDRGLEEVVEEDADLDVDADDVAG